ncbi:hypothetical protein LCL85_12445 [Vibrio alginolyticus]|nr:hypothetical protein [Vibrio alginolyticus]
MKKAVLTSILVLASSSVFAEDFDYVGGGDTSQWDIGGEIAERCVVSTYAGGDRSTTLNLGLAEAQTTASVTLWCNTHSAKASTTYSSLNGGVMVNEVGDEIKYTIDISGGEATGLDLATAQTIQQLTGQGTEVGEQTRSVSVTPLVGGREFAGTYSDTITVLVAAN